MSIVIKATDIVTAFGSNIIHDGISCRVMENEIYAILGGSGSGKSTLLREMIMLQRYRSGSIEVLGHNLSDISAKEAQTLRSSWGVLFQSGALYTSLSVGENISFLYKEHTDFSQKIIDELVDLKLRLVGLAPHVRYLYPSELSGGMIKRVALARALALDPKLLFLDEPTSGLDPLSARAFDTLISNLRDILGITVVIVTHDLDTITDIVDRFVLIGDKKVLIEGNLEEALALDIPQINNFFATR